MPKCEVAAAVRARFATLSAPLISVSVDGARSAEPPISSGTCAAAHWITSCDALRVAIMPASGPLRGHVGVPALGQLAREHPLELRRRVGEVGAVGARSARATPTRSSSPRAIVERKCSSASSGTKNGSSLGQL